MNFKFNSIKLDSFLWLFSLCQITWRKKSRNFTRLSRVPDRTILVLWVMLQTRFPALDANLSVTSSTFESTACSISSRVRGRPAGPKWCRKSGKFSSTVSAVAPPSDLLLNGCWWNTVFEDAMHNHEKSADKQSNGLPSFPNDPHPPLGRDLLRDWTDEWDATATGLGNQAEPSTGLDLIF